VNESRRLRMKKDCRFSGFGFRFYGPWRAGPGPFPRREEYMHMLEEYKEHLEEYKRELEKELEEVERETGELKR